MFIAMYAGPVALRQEGNVFLYHSPDIALLPEGEPRYPPNYEHCPPDRGRTAHPTNYKHSPPDGRGDSLCTLQINVETRSR